jgi:hypothetical protein
MVTPYLSHHPQGMIYIGLSGFIGLPGMSFSGKFQRLIYGHLHCHGLIIPAARSKPTLKGLRERKTTPQPNASRQFVELFQKTRS